ncbi:MAG: ABC transporter permease [Ilumatobacter sp.]|uniref:ABC transporter permease n=1 Tax=Ilumatobacter sp. TaxID=1967498 RepID=UPI003297D3F2
MNTTHQLTRLAAITRRDWQIERSYRLRYPVRIFQVAITMAILYHVSQLVTDAPELQAFGGDYFDFAVVGLAVVSISQLGISTFNANILREQSLGTMEVLLSTPTPIWVWLAGSFAFPMILTAINVVMYVGIGIGVMGNGLSIGGLLMALVVLVLTLLSFCAFGIAGASFVLLLKRGDPLAGPLALFTSIVSGALFPVSTMPAPFVWLAHAFPAFYGINGLRTALLTDAAPTDVIPDILMLMAFDVVLLPASLLLFNRALRAARTAGTLANY